MLVNYIYGVRTIFSIIASRCWHLQVAPMVGVRLLGQ